MTASSPAEKASGIDRNDLGFLLAKAAQRWNELLAERFAAAGYGDVRPSYGSVLLPLFEEDGQRMGELARRARLSKQTMTEMVRLLERDGLIERRGDPSDGQPDPSAMPHAANVAKRSLYELIHDRSRLMQSRK